MPSLCRFPIAFLFAYFSRPDSFLSLLPLYTCAPSPELRGSDSACCLDRLPSLATLFFVFFLIVPHRVRNSPFFLSLAALLSFEGGISRRFLDSGFFMVSSTNPSASFWEPQALSPCQFHCRMPPPPTSVRLHLLGPANPPGSSRFHPFFFVSFPV